MVVAQTTVSVVVQTASTVAYVVQTTVEVEDVHPMAAAMVDVPPSGLLHSHSTSHMLFLGVGNMHDNPYPPARHNGKMCSINSSAS